MGCDFETGIVEGIALLVQQSCNGCPVDSCERFQLQNVDSPLARLTLRNEALRSSEGFGSICLRHSNFDARLPEPLEKALVRGRMGGLHRQLNGLCTG